MSVLMILQHYTHQWSEALLSESALLPNCQQKHSHYLQQKPEQFRPNLSIYHYLLFFSVASRFSLSIFSNVSIAAIFASHRAAAPPTTTLSGSKWYVLALTFFFGFSTFSVLTSLSGIVTVSETGGVSKSDICSSDVADIWVLSETGGIVFFLQREHYYRL